MAPLVAVNPFTNEMISSAWLVLHREPNDEQICCRTAAYWSSKLRYMSECTILQTATRCDYGPHPLRTETEG